MYLSAFQLHLLHTSYICFKFKKYICLKLQKVFPTLPAGSSSHHFGDFTKVCIKSILNCFLHDLKSIMASRRGNGRSDRGPENLFCICCKKTILYLLQNTIMYLLQYTILNLKYRLFSFFCCNYFDNSQCKFCVLR